MKRYNNFIILVLLLTSCAVINPSFKKTAVISKEAYEAIKEVSVNETERIVLKFRDGKGTESDRELLRTLNKLNHILEIYKPAHNSYVLALQSAELTGKKPPDFPIIYNKLIELSSEIVTLAREVGILK